MKKLLFLLSFVMLLRPVIPVIEYVVNYEYISKVLCLNKAKPAMHCNGKCHLMKELAKASESEKPISSDKKNAAQESEVLFFQELGSFEMPQHYFHDVTKAHYSYTNLYSHPDSCSVFHPPALIS